MPLFFLPMLGLMGIGIALIRRYAKAPVASEDMATRLLRWAVGLLAAERAEWGQAMLGELDHIDGRIRRWRFALGCVGAALVLPHRGARAELGFGGAEHPHRLLWGRAAGVWAMVALAVGSLGVYASVALRYRLGGGDWVAAAIVAVVLAGLLLGAGALLRRPGVALPGLVGGALVALAWLSLSGFTFYRQIAPDIVHWHQLVEAVVLPFVVGAAGTVWSGDPVAGKRIARLAGITAGLGRYAYATVAVAVLGAGGPLWDGSTRYIVSDRLGNNLALLLFSVLVTTTVGWGGAATAGAVTGWLRG